MSVDDKQVRYDAACDGCFPLTTNDPKLTDTDVLAAYRYQPNLVKRHHELKSVQDAAPVQLKSPFRIEALFACQFIALLTNCQLVALRWICFCTGRAGASPKVGRFTDLAFDSELITTTEVGGQTSIGGAPLASADGTPAGAEGRSRCSGLGCDHGHGVAGFDRRGKSLWRRSRISTR